ncbi:MAG TPA: DUF3800 domain-containing protein [Solirubrobacterales bacterium]|nr:DUF3800 domain-containing protein [Solirubrobacterales bacterium]
MGSLVAVGGFHVPGASVLPLRLRLDEICERYGFPSHDEEFKWSPDRKSWMHGNLQFESREKFYVDCLKAAADHEAEACVVIEDANYKTMSGSAEGHELDAVKILLERIDWHLHNRGTDGLVVADDPSGGREAEAEFVAECLRTLREGTRFMDLKRISLVLTEDSKSTRLLQLADLIVGCTVAYVGGEDRFSPPLFEPYIKPLLRSDGGRIGGVGLKIHPDLRYGNLYHWLVGDEYLKKHGTGHPLPANNVPYVNSANDPGSVTLGAPFARLGGGG